MINQLKPSLFSSEICISLFSFKCNALWCWDVMCLFSCSEPAAYLVCFPQPLSLFAIQFLNAVGDLLDLIPALVPEQNPPLRDFKLPGMGHCSALLKVRCLNMAEPAGRLLVKMQGGSSKLIQSRLVMQSRNHL